MVSSSKIDYDLSPPAWLASRWGADSCGTPSNTLATAQYSDHCYLSGTFSS